MRSFLEQFSAKKRINHTCLVLYYLPVKNSTEIIKTVLRFKSQKPLGFNRNIHSYRYLSWQHYHYTLNGQWSEVKRCQQQPTTTSIPCRLIPFNIFNKWDSGIVQTHEWHAGGQGCHSEGLWQGGEMGWQSGGNCVPVQAGVYWLGSSSAEKDLGFPVVKLNDLAVSKEGHPHTGLILPTMTVASQGKVLLPSPL